MNQKQMALKSVFLDDYSMPCISLLYDTEPFLSNLFCIKMAFQISSCERIMTHDVNLKISRHIPKRFLGTCHLSVR